jgi:transposase
MNSVTKNFVGVDVSKNWLDVHIHPKNQMLRVDNTTAGLDQLLAILSQDTISQIVCESSGGYENLLMGSCDNAGYRVWRVDPKRIKAFIVSEGIKAKTDKIDAKMIALFASQKEAPYISNKRSDCDEKINILIRRKEDLTSILVMEKQRLNGPTGKFCKDKIERFINIIEQDIEDIEDEIQDCILQDSHLSSKSDILQSIPGIGKATAATFIAHMPELGIVDNKKVAALLGVVPYTRQSGMHRGRETISGGRSAPRKALYMAALSATRFNKPMKTFYDRLREKGKKPKVAIVAVMHKLVVTMNAMVRKGEKWGHA